MSIKKDSKLNLSPEVLGSLAECKEVMREIRNALDVLSGHLADITCELPKQADPSEDADLEIIHDMYMTLPVWDTVDNFLKAVESVMARAEKDGE